MSDIERRLANWLAKLGPPVRRADPDQEMEWLIHDALEEIRKLRAQVRMNPPTVGQEHRTDAATKLVADWMIARSYATGHGDTVADLLGELEWQAKERGSNAR